MSTDPTMAGADPLKDLSGLIGALQAASADLQTDVDALLRLLPMAEGRLADLLRWLCLSSSTMQPDVRDTHLILFASAYRDITPVEAVKAFVASARAGAAPVNLLSVDDGLGLRLMDLAVDAPYQVGSFSDGQFVAAAAYGMEVLATGASLLGLADAAFGNDIFALAVLMATAHGDPDILARAVPPELLEPATSLAGQVAGKTGLAVLCGLGGHEMAAGLGAMIAAAGADVPVLIEGVGMLAAYSALRCESELAVRHIRWAGAGTDMEAAMGAYLGLEPLIAGATGAGPGAALALSHRIVKAAAAARSLKPVGPTG